MSRIGNRAVPVPDGVTIELAEGSLQVKGPRGDLSARVPSGIRVEQADGVLRVLRSDDRRESRALHGLARSLVANMVTGVTTGFSRELEIHGVGYRAEMSGNKLNLALGFSHPVVFEVPKGLSVSLEGNTRIRIQGADKELVGQFAADVRSTRPPEPYKGKGIRYSDERVRRKVGKAGVT